MRDSSPQTSPTRVFLTGCSSSQTAPAWVLPTGCSPSGTGFSSVGPPHDYKPCQQTCSSVGSSLRESAGADTFSSIGSCVSVRVLAGAWSRTGFPQGNSFLQASTYSGMECSMPCSQIGPVVLWGSSGGGRMLYGALHDKAQKLQKEKVSRASLQR